MAVNDCIKETYLELVRILSLEAGQNKSTTEFLNYIKIKEGDFLDIEKNPKKINLKEFVRGANRFSDEFSFSDANYSNIRKILGKLYDLLDG